VANYNQSCIVWTGMARKSSLTTMADRRYRQCQDCSTR